MTKKKRAKVAPIKPVYGYKDREWIIKDGYGWMKYKRFSSKKAAHEGVKHIRKIFRTAGNMTSVRTTRGWTVFQLPKSGFRTPSFVILKNGKRKY